MAPNNALGKPTAARLRASYEGTPASSSKSPPRRASRSPAARRRKAETSVDSVRVSSADGFGATSSEQLPSPNVLDRSEVTGRGTGTAVRTPLEEFEARPRDELRCFWTAVMFLTRLPCPGWCDHHPGYLMRAMAYFPLIGALIGVWAAAIYDAAACVWPPLVAAALSGGGTLWLTGCFHEDGLCDTLDGFGGGWTKSQILRIMRDSRNGSYATMGGCLWVVAKAAAIAQIGSGAGRSVWALGACSGAGPAIVVAQGVARASAAPLIFAYTYIVDDEDAKGEYYNWFGESRRLLGLPRVVLSCGLATALACAAYGVDSLSGGGTALRVLVTTAFGTFIAGEYGRSVLGGVMGDFLGAAICVLELAIYLAISIDLTTFGKEDARALGWLGVVLSAPQIYGVYRRWYERRHGLATVPPAPQEC